MSETTTPTNTIRVLSFPVGQPPIEKWIERGLEPMQAEVGGYIQMVPFLLDHPRMLDVCCNEEGKFNPDCKPNRRFGGDILVGNFFVTATNPEDGEGMDLTDEDIAAAIAFFHDNEL